MSIMALMAGGLSPPRRGRLAAAAAATAAGCHRPDQARAGLADAQRDGGPGGAAAAGEGGNCGSGDGKRGGGGEGGGDGRRRHRARRRLARRACAPPHVRGGLVRPGRARWVCAPQPPGIIHDDRHDRWMRRAVAKGGGRGRGVVCPCRARSTSLLVSQQPTRPRLITRAAHACCPVKNVAAFLDMARIGTWTLIRFQSVCHVFCHFASCTSRGPLSRSLVWCHSMRPRATQGPSTVAGRPAAHPAPLMARARDALHVGAARLSHRPGRNRTGARRAAWERVGKTRRRGAPAIAATPSGAAVPLGPPSPCQRGRPAAVSAGRPPPHATPAAGGWRGIGPARRMGGSSRRGGAMGSVLSTPRRPPSIGARGGIAEGGGGPPVR